MVNYDMLIISGLSGAGKSSAIKVLEDIGYNPIDNVPLEVVERIMEIFYAAENKVSKIAFIIDSRSKDHKLAFNMIMMLKNRYNAKLIFMDANKETLIRRYQETRRIHPQGNDLVNAINTEKTLMADIKDIADYIFVSDGKTVHELADELKKFCGKDLWILLITLQSFGFKHGIPSESDLLFDIRFLKNPYFVDDLKELNGTNNKVVDYIKTDPNYQVMLNKIEDLLTFLIPLYLKESKRYLNISIGCTGGKHRSVAMIEDLADILTTSTSNIELNIKHRNIFT